MRSLAFPRTATCRHPSNECSPSPIPMSLAEEVGEALTRESALSPAGPASSAACITFVRPIAKSTSPSKISMTGSVSPPRQNAGGRAAQPWRPRRAGLRRHGSAPPPALRRGPISTLAKPATSDPALRASDRRRSAPLREGDRRRRSASPARPRPLAEAAAEEPASAPPSRTCSASAVTQTPRPGSFRRRSGTTAPSGAATKRISRSAGSASRVTMQVRVWRLVAGRHPACPYAVAVAGAARAAGSASAAAAASAAARSRSSW